MAQRVYQSTSDQRVYVVRVGEVSKRPSNGTWKTNNPYTFTHARAPGNVNNGLTPFVTASECTPIGIPVSATNRLYSKIREAVQGPSGELLTSALEWRSTLDMITKRAILLRKAYLAARRFDLPEVAKILSLTKRQRIAVEGRIRKMHIQERPTQIWLEYWMGWAPLIGDIGHALSTLEAPPPLNQRFREGVRYTVPAVRNEPWGKPGGSSYQLELIEQSGQVSAYGQFKVTNHNLRLATQLGFVNPVLTAWQMLPFSFMVDWFANVGDCLSQFSDFAGVELINTGQASLRQITVTRSGVRRVSDPNPPFYRDHYFSSKGKGETRQRGPGAIPRPVFQVGLPKLNLTRAATSISLLVETFLIKK